MAKMNYLETVNFYMEEYGMSEDDACRCADADFNPDYNADDYDDPEGQYSTPEIW